MSSSQFESPKATIEVPDVYLSHEAQPSRSEPQPSPTKTPIFNQLPSIVSSPTPSSFGSHHTRNIQNPKKFVVYPSPSATIEKEELEGFTSTSRFLQTTEKLVERDEGVEVSSQRVEEGFVTEMVTFGLVEGVPASGVSETPTAQGFDTNVLSSSGNSPPSSIGTTLMVPEGEVDGIFYLFLLVKP